jgi:hypothetical protein
MSRARSRIFVLLLGLALLPCLAWKGEGAGLVRPISEVLEKAEQGDRITVEGEIVDIEDAQGSLRLATLDDGTGQVLVAVPEHLRRNVEREPGEDMVGVRFRVHGRWDHAYMKSDVFGIRAQQIERLPSL